MTPIFSGLIGLLGASLSGILLLLKSHFYLGGFVLLYIIVMLAYTEYSLRRSYRDVMSLEHLSIIKASRYFISELIKNKDLIIPEKEFSLKECIFLSNKLSSHNKLQLISKMLLEHLNLKNIEINIQESKDLKNGAEIQWIKGQVNLTYNAKYLGSIFSILTILCHEFTHIYLFENNIRYPDTQQNEIITEIASFFLGFADAQINGIQEHELITTKFKGITGLVFGYLNPGEIALIYLQYCRAKQRKQNLLHKNRVQSESIRFAKKCLINNPIFSKINWE